MAQGDRRRHRGRAQGAGNFRRSTTTPAEMEAVVGLHMQIWGARGARQDGGRVQAGVSERLGFEHWRFGLCVTIQPPL